jgi:hypothetical protein
MITKIIVASLMLFSSSFALGGIYCSNAAIDAESRFSGAFGAVGNTGQVIYFGPNDSNSENRGIYMFKTETYMIMEFPGESRHFCNKTGTETWACKRGKSARALRYSMICKDEV